MYVYSKKAHKTRGFPTVQPRKEKFGKFDGAPRRQKAAADGVTSLGFVAPL